MLLKRNDVYPNVADTECGRTPLWWAAKNGHEDVARMLLKRNDVNPQTADAKYHRTPLSWALENGHERIAELLREWAGLILKSTANLQSTEPPPPSRLNPLGPLPKCSASFNNTNKIKSFARHCQFLAPGLASYHTADVMME